MNILITFLGTGSYESIEYKYYSKDFATESTEHLWYALAKNGTGFINKPDQVLILGTTESSWDNLYDLDDKLSRSEKRQKKQEINNLFRQTDIDYEDSTEWSNFKNYFSKNNWYPMIIERGEDRQQQINILKTIYQIDALEGGNVSIDVTHGLRHLPMLGIIIALYLQQVREVDIERIFYGAYDLRETDDYNGKPAPIIDLTGLLEIADWVGKLQTYKKDGDYGVFAGLFKKDGFKKASILKQTAFAERVLHLTTEKGVIEQAQNVYKELSQTELSGISSLFKEALLEQIDWVNKPKDSEKETLYQYQKHLAKQYLENGNYLHAVIFGLEAVITKYCDDDPDKFSSYQFRNKAKGKITGTAQLKDAFNELDSLRNHLAHASTAEIENITNDKKRELTEKNREALAKENSLRDFIEDKFNILLT